MPRKRKYEYRYRYAGSTERCIGKVVEHLYKIGQVESVKGYRYYHNNVEQEYLMIKGKKGHLRLSGFCWGYSGEGPQGVIRVLMMLGVPKLLAEHVAFNSNRNISRGEDWSLLCTTNGVVMRQRFGR